MNKLKNMAVINDLSGSDRCSLTVAIPIINAMGIHCCAMPTAILSNHTGYDEYFFDDYTDKMPEFTHKWQGMNLHFDAIYTGFLGSEHQIQIVEDFIQSFGGNGTKLIVDPVMGDNGKIYTTYTLSMCNEMKKLASSAHVVTPNVTEACQLADVAYTSEEIDADFAHMLCRKIHSMGAECVVLTGVKNDGVISNFVYEGDEIKKYSSPLLSTYFAGTGDVFSSIVAGMVCNGHSVARSVEFATQYIYKVTKFSAECGFIWQEGICIEKFMKELTEI